MNPIISQYIAIIQTPIGYALMGVLCRIFINGRKKQMTLAIISIEIFLAGVTVIIIAPLVDKIGLGKEYQAAFYWAVGMAHSEIMQIMKFAIVGRIKEFMRRNGIGDYKQ